MHHAGPYGQEGGRYRRTLQPNVGQPSQHLLVVPTSLVLPEDLPVQDAPDSCAFRRKSR